MASIIKAPSGDSPGVVVFTTQERDHLISVEPETVRAIESLKKRWVIGLHHNWHDWNFHYNPLFDFSMAGEGDLIEVDGKSFTRLPMDACNFVPDCFYPSESEKFWDILYVARAVFFKRIPEFFNTMRALYDAGKMYRALLISPVPPFAKSEVKTVFYEIRDVYDSMFSKAEQELFTLMTIEYRYPFPFDLPTLGHFYRSSRIFVHFADQERRCRVAGYAWAAGLPVVGMESASSLLPPELAREPGYYRVDDYDEFPNAIEKALNANTKADALQPYRGLFNLKYTRDTFTDELKKIFSEQGRSFTDKHMALRDLDIRLGRHHGFGKNPNSVNVPLIELVKYLHGADAEDLEPYLGSADPETDLVADKFPELRAAPGGSLLRRLAGRLGL